jgi:hypothetical protein
VHAEGVHTADDDVCAIQCLGEVFYIVRLYALRKFSLKLWVIASFEAACDDISIQMGAD